jgi:hypothetical protein
MTEQDNKIRFCPQHQVLGGLSICTTLQLPCSRALKAGLCPLEYKVAQPDGVKKED